MKYSWNQKKEFLISFYEAMFSKCETKYYLNIFRYKVKEIKQYEENTKNLNRLIYLYKLIIRKEEMINKQKTLEIINTQKKYRLNNQEISQKEFMTNQKKIQDFLDLI
ncbi:hypothetical protein GW750_06075 [bacterium]|nr:hypothetical protein [bacterium]